MKFLKILITLLCLFPLSLFAQTISGYVADSATGEALIGASIYESYSQKGAITNKYGFYSLSLPANQHQLTLSISYVGYQTASIEFQLLKDTVLQIKLMPAIQNLAEVIVTDKLSPAQELEAPLGQISIPVERLKQIPLVFGEPDIIKALAMLPGVSIGLEGSSGLLVRGGSQDQNLILLDEAPLYNLSHLFGLVSILNPDAIKKVDLYKGGFPARFGGRLSSIIDITMKEGNSQAKRGEWSIGLLTSRFLLEGPLTKKLKNRTSYLFSARTFHIGLFTLPMYIAYKAGRGDRFVTYLMYDTNFKINHKFSNGSGVFFSFYQGTDFYRAGEGDAKQRSDFGLTWGNTTATTRYVRPLSSKIFFRSVLTYSKYRYGIDIESFKSEDDKFVKDDFFSSRPSVRDWTLKAGIDYFPTPNHQVKLGIEGTSHRYQPSYIRTSYQLDEEKLQTINEPVVANETAIFAEDETSILPWLKTNVGLRSVVFHVENKNYFSLEPRFTANVLLPANFAFKGAYSQMRQFIHLLVNNGLGLPNDIWVPATRQVAPQYAQQFALGLSKTLPSLNLELSLESYYKKMSNLIDYKDGANYLTNFNQSWQESIAKAGKGEAYGLELFINKTQGRFNGWAAYTLAYNRRRFTEINEGRWFWANFDRRHTISLTGSYNITPKINVSANWILQTGAPVTVPVAIRTDFERGFPVFVYRDRNNFRMPAYHRLDLSFNFALTTRKGKQAGLSVGVYNLYNRANPFYVDISKRIILQEPRSFGAPIIGTKNTLQAGSFLPILPFVSYTKKFK